MQESVGKGMLCAMQMLRCVMAAEQAGRAPLSRFFAFHMFFIPVLIFAAEWHLRAPEPGWPVDPKTYRAGYRTLLQRQGQSFWPDVAWRGGVFGVGLIVTIVCLAWLFGPLALGIILILLPFIAGRGE
jgi:ubiquinol-cytochrome c reductase cytochrome b subunit